MHRAGRLLPPLIYRTGNTVTLTLEAWCHANLLLLLVKPSNRRSGSSPWNCIFLLDLNVSQNHNIGIYYLLLCTLPGIPSYPAPCYFPRHHAPPSHWQRQSCLLMSFTNKWWTSFTQKELNITSRYHCCIKSRHQLYIDSWTYLPGRTCARQDVCQPQPGQQNCLSVLVVPCFCMCLQNHYTVPVYSTSQQTPAILTGHWYMRGLFSVSL